MVHIGNRVGPVRIDLDHAMTCMCRICTNEVDSVNLISGSVSGESHPHPAGPWTDLPMKWKRCIDVNAEKNRTVPDKTVNDILNGNIDDPMVVSIDGRSIKVDAWDFRHLIQMKGVMPSRDDVDFDRQCFKGGPDRFDRISDIVREIVLSDEDLWRVLRRAEYHSKSKSALAEGLYRRFSDLIGSGYMEKREGASIQQYILDMAVNTGSRKSTILGMLLDENCCQSIDSWYSSMDLSGMFKACYQREMFQRVRDMAESYADELASSSRPCENMEQFSERLFDDVTTMMRKGMNSDVDLKRVIGSENLYKKLCDATGRV